ncbi:carbohydrate kinase family protein [Mesoplasma lactucae]|uniref:Carbohydrate kinase PfkB domain-containing protein n=1 Tax=Mesoplasma lactucae ATCC 49193 TaxID=81460 RepID=A0A291IS80_9MOLU|nr:carbohydrate kinase [Mesoplasma lactucae]ATG97547.1 hypothetical protein CP520_02155 [Mesoplasma lactucae ATCC 49193]ATZ19994.1 fructokinase [Mesoplasma lactucae ATCC 49193]MCL8217055.1 Fructokinase [Mesoplasma lactucae ATCC 49193]
MKNIGIIGEALIDKYNENEQIGGASFNVACSLSRQDNSAYFLGAISTDNRGNKIKEGLNKYQVKTNFVEETNVPTTLAEVTLDDHKERTFVFTRGSDAYYQIKDFNFDDFNFDFIHFGSATGFLPGELKESYLTLKDYCLKNNIPYSFDPNFRPALWLGLDIQDYIYYVKEYLKTASVVKISDNELLLITKELELDKAVEKLKDLVEPTSLVAITCGCENTIALYKNESWIVPVTPAKQLADTTGAGDAFASRLIHLYNQVKPEDLNKEMISKIVMGANDFGKDAVEHIGALTYLDYLK